MKRTLLKILLLFSTVFVFAQEENPHLDAALGLRVKRNGLDIIVYTANNDLTLSHEDYRKINYRVYFRKVNYPVKSFPIDEVTKKFQLITIPASSKELRQKEKEKEDNSTPLAAIGTYPRAGKTISKEDYDSNFWIEESLIEDNTDTEYYKYSSDVFSGLLTAPFKYRLKLGNAPEAIIDGDFNIAPFIGWKWRVSSKRQFYIAPFSFAGMTTLGFNSANNTKITDADKLENGSGLTYGLGLSFRLGSVSPGFIIGWDKGFGDLGSGFMYNDKAWISFSVNYDFFKPQKTSEAQE